MFSVFTGAFDLCLSVQILEAYKCGAAALRAMRRETPAHEVEEVMDELQEVRKSV